MAKTSTKTKTAKPVKKQESSSDSSSSSSSSSSDSSSSDSDSSDSEEETKASKKESSDSDSSDSDSDSDSDSEPEKDTKEAKKESSDSDSSDSDSSDSEEDTKETKKESSDSDSSSSDSSDSEEETKDAKKDAKKEETDSSSSSSDSSDSSDSESESEEKDTKRKAEEEPEQPAKKAKVEEVVTLFVGRLSWNIDSDWLKSEFEPLGGVLGARVIMEKETGRSKGYGYVDFESKDAADKALSEYQGREIDGRPINLDMTQSKPKQNIQNDRSRNFGDVKSAPSDTLFVGNLSFDASQSTLYDAFGNFGTIVSCRVPTHQETQQPKGFGYVQFSSVDEAKAALDAMNGASIANRACRLDFSTPRDPSNANGGNRGGFGGRGGRGGRGGFGGRGGNFAGRERGPPRTGANAAEFKGTKKTFD